MSEERKSHYFGSFLMPKARFIIWMNILISLIVSSIGFGLGFSQQWLTAQQVILYTILTSGSLFLILNYTASIFESRLEAERSKSELEREEERKRANNCGLKTEF